MTCFMSRLSQLGGSKAASSGADRPAERPQAAPELPLDCFGQALRRELARRITELSTYSETTCGPLGSGDFAATIVLFVLVPLLLVWMMR